MEHWTLVKGAGILQEETGGQRDSTGSLPQLSLWKRKVMSKTRDILFPKTFKGDTEAGAELPLDYPRPLPRTGVGKRCWHHWATWHHGVWVLSELQRKHSLLSVSMVHVIRKTLKRVRALWWHHREGWGALCSLAGAQAGQGRRGGAEWVGRVLVWEHLQCNSFQGHPGIMRREGWECEWGTWNLTVLCSKPPNTDASWTWASGQGPDSGHVEWRCSWKWRPTSDMHTTVGGGEAPGESLVRSPSWLIRIQRLVLRKLSLCVHFEVSEGSWFPPPLLFLLPPTLRVDSCPWFWISSNEAHSEPAFSSN